MFVYVKINKLKILLFFIKTLYLSIYIYSKDYCFKYNSIIKSFLRYIFFLCCLFMMFK
uniref:Uncharacterized protein n=1 Tax=Parastrongyloides trichosuri TaxID=131310 RepID=A0A0N5A2K6_PARTI